MRLTEAGGKVPIPAMLVVVGNVALARYAWDRSVPWERHMQNFHYSTSALLIGLSIVSVFLP